MEVLDTARSHGAHLDAKGSIENGLHTSSTGSLIIASAAQPDGEFNLGGETGVDSSSTPQATKYVASNGLSFSR